MSTFGIKKIMAIKGKQQFYQLTIDDHPDLTGAISEEEVNERKTGVLDIYEKNLEKSYRKNLIQIYNIMERVANNVHVPGDKYHEMTGRDKSDPHKDYEFKHGDLRVYAIKTSSGKVIILCGYKNSQSSDIRQMRQLKKQFLNSLYNI